MQNNDERKQFTKEELAGEIWIDAKNYEGRYQVSNLGRVKSLLTNKILKPAKSNRGYLHCNLIGASGDKKSRYVHRLVAESFMNNPANYPCINHIDENQLNNRLSNLEFCNQSYNISWTLNGCTAIEQYDIYSNQTIEIFALRNDIKSKYPKANLSNISSCLHHRRKSAGGFGWRFADAPLDLF